MNTLAKISAFCVMICFTASSQTTTVRNLRLDAPVDTNTIAVAYSAITNAVATAVRLGQLDQAALARAVAVGQDLRLIETSTNGWVVGVSNIVEVDQAHIPGVLFVGSIIYGAPRDGGYISITGSPFFYDRQIPGEADPLAGFGEVVTDPYMDWRLRSFFLDWASTNRAMWAEISTINNLPSTLVDDMRTYTAVTNIPPQVRAVRDEINATNAVIRSVIENAISQASSGGGGQSWTTSTTSDRYIDCADHCITICDRMFDWDNWENEFYITMPTSTGTAHSIVAFVNAYDFGENGGQIQYSLDGTAYYDDSAWGFQRQIPYWNSEYQSIDYSYSSCSVVVIDIQEIGADKWVVSWKGFN